MFYNIYTFFDVNLNITLKPNQKTNFRNMEQIFREFLETL